MFDFSGLSTAVITGEEDVVLDLTQKAISAKVDPLSIINDGLIAGMNVVGARFKVNDMYVPEVLMSAAAMKAGVALVKPLLTSGETTTKGTVVIGTVTGDLHDIGKSLVGMMLECSGYAVIDLGVDVSGDDFVAAVKANNAGIVALSCMLTTTMLQMKTTIEVLAANGLRKDVKVIIGGAPITQEFADNIGSDGYATDAAGAVDLVTKLLN
ncbi:cobalamin B12-binding domain-containing protein [Desulfosporosinus metallidurans]|uniref:5-methyltetrahydrofolate--homocysteine methyltransferase n=1 Tax=Desulfosporosinus metallidurans TaxID=1888891 RepID=A0A1Q8QFS1_9FIRM|nr:corrinoid protein [Desulfosporosinus metallidurans]OLN26148.1 5-methyltetrahydrofolate--homocysteine methyltransferase [Desulfosporosinus metallidurans]